MNSRKAPITLVLTMLIAGCLFVLPAVAESDFGAAGAEADSSRTLEEMLNYAIEDEFAARAEYEMIIAEYGELRPFCNIIRAEEYHIAQLIPLFHQFDFEVPEDASSSFVVVPESLENAFENGLHRYQ